GAYTDYAILHIKRAVPSTTTRLYFRMGVRGPLAPEKPYSVGVRGAALPPLAPPLRMESGGLRPPDLPTLVVVLGNCLKGKCEGRSPSRPSHPLGCGITAAEWVGKGFLGGGRSPSPRFRELFKQSPR